MNDMDVNNPSMSALLYVTLCHIIGFPTQVRIRREMLDLQGEINRLQSMKTKQMKLTSGSYGEGFRLPGSDIDTMLWPKDHKVIWDYNQSDFYRSSDTTLIMMECCETRPGFALLQLLTQPREKVVKSAGTRMNNGLYISSSLYRERTLTTIFKNSVTHGPCASGCFAGIVEYDNAHCFSCDFWPPLASSFIERSQIRGWPPSRILRDIVDNECHLVAIGGKNSPQEHDEWLVSFSVAEQKLVYTMNHCQFLCYGMLKILLKEVLISYSDEHLLCSYFLKRVVFWEIQGQENHTWTPQNILTCIWLCVKHLIKLVYREKCPNFFIPSNNMFYGKIVGAARIRLLSHLEDVYSTGISCLIDCPSISEVLERQSTQRINENLSTADCDIELFCEINKIRDTCIWDKSDSIENLNNISVLKTKEQMPLSEYQSLALQTLISDALVSTAVNLYDVYNRSSYTNRVQYNVDRKLRHMLYSAAKCGDISHLLYIAMYYYMTCRYKQALYYVEMTKCKLSKPIVMFLGELKVDKTSYDEAVHGMSSSTRMREAYTSGVRLHSKRLFIRELTLEIKAAEWKTGTHLLQIPPHVIVSLLSVLCNRGNHRKQEEAIYDLQTLLTHDDEEYISSGLRSISWQILGLSQQSYGDLRAALISYKQALKYTERQINQIEEATKVRIQRVQCALEANSLYQ